MPEPLEGFNPLDRGDWVVMHPDEVVATLLIPLPDPLALPNGVIWPVYQQLELATSSLLDRLADQLWLQPIDGARDSVPFRRLRAEAPIGTDSSGGHLSRINLVNKHALTTSIQFHKTFNDAGLRLGFEPAVRLASAVSGERLTTDEIARRAEGSLGGVPSTGGPSPEQERTPAPALRELGLGAVTVAECAVGLRIVSDLPDADEVLAQGPGVSAPGPIEADILYNDNPAMWPWRVLPPGHQPDPQLVERRVRYALDVALAELRSIQRGIHALKRSPIPLVSTERLPVLVPVLLRHASMIGDARSPTVFTMLATRPNIESDREPDPLSDEELQMLNQARTRADGGAFAAHLDMHREGLVALHRHGDLRLAAMLFGIAAESLLDELILHLMWEELVPPEHAAINWVAGLDTRIQRELPTRLGGSWDITRHNPVGRWAQDVAALRHRVAHAAYTPTAEETQRSLSSTNGLVTHLCDRLAQPSVLTKYPRTALALAGEGGLRNRDVFTGRIRKLASSTNEIDWEATYVRWREAWRRTRHDNTARPRTPDPVRASLLAVLHGDGTTRWCLHDRQQHLALPVTVDETDLPSSFDQQLEAIRHEVYAAASDTPDAHPPVSVAYQGRIQTTPVHGRGWTEEYHLVPMTGVMADRSDYRHSP